MAQATRRDSIPDAGFCGNIFGGNSHLFSEITFSFFYRPGERSTRKRARDIQDASKATARNTGMKLVVALNYGGRAELVDAFNSILDQVRANGMAAFHADESTISERLYTAGLPDPDLLIGPAERCV